ncbi:hypothetical protein FDECE_2311 [Fusarium decemcellulare]|nr:hypothetical protein FDECE_2311 [Fusarium decemcellulare]
MDGRFSIYTVWTNWTQARLSGIGRRGWCDVIPLDEAVTEHVPSAIVDEAWLMVRLLEHSFDPALYAVWHPQTVWGFPLHDCCWHILRANDPSMSEEVVVQSFFDLLRYELGPTVVCPGESTILDRKALIGKAYMSNPLDIPELQSILEEDDLEFPFSQADLLISPAIDKDPFSMFPDEVLVRILAHLHSKDVVSLLCSSGQFVNAGLPGPFWRSRFWPARSDVEVIFDDSLGCAYRIPSLELARDPRGIRGIRALSAENCWSKWVGNHVDLPRTMITCDQLHEGSTTPTLTIVAGFDATKMVYVNVKGAKTASLRDTRLWYPEIPEPHLHLLGTDHEKLQEFRGALPHSVCMFGGPNGAWLPHLKEVIVWGIDRSSLGEWGDNTCVMGIQFQYDKELNNGQDSMLLGHIPGPDMVKSFLSVRRVLIDSTAGERITGIDVMYQSPYFMAGFIVNTSFGRRREFPPYCKHYIDQDQDEGSDDFSEKLFPAPETDIVGFYATLEHNDIINEHDKVLTDLGVIYANKV